MEEYLNSLVGEGSVLFLWHLEGHTVYKPMLNSCPHCYFSVDLFCNIMQLNALNVCLFPALP